jgi:hypothetical protein
VRRVNGWQIELLLVLVQPEMERARSPLVSIPPFRRGLFRHEAFDEDFTTRGVDPALPIIASRRPPEYPSAWLLPSRARFRLTWQNDFTSHWLSRLLPPRLL